MKIPSNYVILSLSFKEYNWAMVYVQPNKFFKFWVSRIKKICKHKTVRLSCQILISVKDKIIISKLRELILKENDINKEIDINKFNWLIFLYLLIS